MTSPHIWYTREDVEPQNVHSYPEVYPSGHLIFCLHPAFAMHITTLGSSVVSKFSQSSTLRLATVALLVLGVSVAAASSGNGLFTWKRTRARWLQYSWGLLGCPRYGFLFLFFWGRQWSNRPSSRSRLWHFIFLEFKIQKITKVIGNILPTNYYCINHRKCW